MKIFIIIITLLVSVAGYKCVAGPAANWVINDSLKLKFYPDKCDVAADGIDKIKEIPEYSNLTASISDEKGNLLFYAFSDFNSPFLFIKDESGNIIQNGKITKEESTYNTNFCFIPFYDEHIYYFVSTKVNYDYTKFFLEFIKIVKTGSSYSVEKIETSDINVKYIYTLTAHSNQKDYWIAFRNGDNPKIINSLLITKNGISNNIENTVYSEDNTGDIKFSPDSKIIVETDVFERGFKVCDFDNSTGLITERIDIFGNGGIKIRGAVEFSPDSRYLYITEGHSDFRIWQFDISIKDYTGLINSKRQIYSVTLPDVCVDCLFKDLQLGEDGKIYISIDGLPFGKKTPFSNFSVINCPNEEGEKCDYRHLAIDMQVPLPYRNGTQIFSTNWFDITKNVKLTAFGNTKYCAGSEIYLSASAKNICSPLKWITPKGNEILSENLKIPSALNSDEGWYKVRGEVCSKIYYDSLFIEVKKLEKPVLEYSTEDINKHLCDSLQKIHVSANQNGYDSYLWIINGKDTVKDVESVFAETGSKVRLEVSLNGCNTFSEIVLPALKGFADFTVSKPELPESICMGSEITSEICFSLNSNINKVFNIKSISLKTGTDMKIESLPDFTKYYNMNENICFKTIVSSNHFGKISDTAVITVNINECERSIEIPLNTKITENTLSFSIPDTSAVIGDASFKLPVYFNNKCEYFKTEGPDTVGIIMDSPLLVISNAQNAVLNQISLSGNKTEIQLIYPNGVELHGTNGVLDYIYGTVVLSTITKSDYIFSTENGFIKTFITNLKNGSITVDEICLHDLRPIIYAKPIQVQFITESEIIKIEGLNRAAEYEIYDLTGSRVARGETEGSINAAHLNQGVYFIKIYNKYYKVMKM